MRKCNRHTEIGIFVERLKMAKRKVTRNIRKSLVKVIRLRRFSTVSYTFSKYSVPDRLSGNPTAQEKNMWIVQNGFEPFLDPHNV